MRRYEKKCINRKLHPTTRNFPDLLNWIRIKSNSMGNLSCDAHQIHPRLVSNLTYYRLCGPNK